MEPSLGAMKTKAWFHAAFGISVGLLTSVTAISGEPLGLVLSGGGAKGAYETGVWKALNEAELTRNVVAISGTSIGAINAALFSCIGKTGEVERIWLDEVDGILSVNEDYLLRFGTPEEREREAAIMKSNIAADIAAEAKRRKTDVDKLPPEIIRTIETKCQSVSAKKLLIRHGNQALWNSLRGVLKDGCSDGLLDSGKLFSVLTKNLPTFWPSTAPTAYATALEKLEGGVYSLTLFRLNDGENGSRISEICASAAIPVGFDTVSIDGKNYVDGGWEAKGGNNVPLGPILERHPEIKTAIVVYLADEKHLNRDRFEKNRAAATAAGVRLVEIVPSEDIGGAFGWAVVFDASPETARHLIELGRKDARKVLVEAGLMKK